MRARSVINAGLLVSLVAIALVACAESPEAESASAAPSASGGSTSASGGSSSEGEGGGSQAGGAATGEAGAPGQGGETAQGGESAQGGQSAQGGDSGQGGQVAQGGMVAQGGQSAQGGMVAQGGQNAQAGSSAAGGPSGPTSFVRHTVDAAAKGAAWITADDVDGDGKIDLVASNFGALGAAVPAGEVKIYHWGADLTMWAPETLVPTDYNIKFPNGTTVVDIDGDGDKDVVVAAGFLVCTAIPGGQPCSGLFWMENQGGSWAPHIVVPGNAELFYHHAEVIDFDGDGVLDLVTVAEQQKTGIFGPEKKAQAEWYKGTGDADRFEKTAHVIGDGGGSVPTVADVDGDGDLDIISAEYFVKDGSFAWFERTSGTSFVRHVIDNSSGPSIMMKLVPNLYGDGVTRAVGSNHTNTAKLPADPQESAIFVFDKPADPKQPWTKTQISQGIKSGPGSFFAPQAAPGIFGSGDIDGDGDIDLLVSGDGDPRVFWMEQKAPGQFEMHVLEEKMAQAGGMVVIDLNGDGKNELVVAAYEQNAIYVYERQ